jgi:hypothetical protein
MSGISGVGQASCSADGGSLAQGGEGLGTMWGEQRALELLEAAGFTSVEVKHVDGDFMHAYFVATKR